MMRPISFLRRLAADNNGATLVEFGFIALPMCTLLLGGLDLGYQSYVRSTMQGALNESARKAAVKDPSFVVAGDTVEEKVENYIKGVTQKVAVNSTIDVRLQSYFDFSDVGNPEKLMTDIDGNGQYDESDGDCFEDANGNEQFDTDAGTDGRGGANDVVFYTAEISMPRLLPWHNFVPGLSPTIDMELKTAVRSQPYGTQETKPVICGTAI
jgi:Flp pilus assembly pilin Flp